MRREGTYQRTGSPGCVDALVRIHSTFKTRCKGTIALKRTPKQVTDALSKVLDLSYLREVTGGDEGLIQELVQLFVEETEQRLEILRAAFEGSHLEDAKREAHTLKGSSSQLGEGDLQDTVGALEEALRKGRHEEAHALFEQLEHDFMMLQAFATPKT